MAGPWEKYQTAPPAAPAAPAGPWDKFKKASAPVAAPAPAAAAPVPAQPSLTDTIMGGKDSYVGQGMSGVNTGIADTLSLPTNILNTALSLGPNLVNTIFGTDFKKPDYVPDPGADAKKLMESVGAITPETTDPGKQFVRHAGETLGAATIPLAGETAVAAQPIRTLVSELATTTGAALGGATADAVAPDNPYAEIVGQILGGGAAGLAKGVARRTVTPFPTSPERQAAAQTMADNGVELSAGQQTGNKGLQYAESELGGAAVGDLNERQAEQFTHAVLHQAGINANRATPQVIDDAFTRIGHDFDNLAAQTTVPLDQQLQTDMLQVATDYQAVAGTPARVVEQMVNRAGELAAQNGGVLSGAAYQNLRSSIGRLSRAADGPTGIALRDLQGALDDAVQRHMPPDLLGQWQEARRQYQNLMVIERASTGAGENAALGLISPAKLRQSVVAQNQRGYVRGQGDFNDLSHAGQATMTPLPQSGTAPRTAVRNMGAALPSVIGAAVGAPGGIAGSLAGAAAGALVPHIIGQGILSPLGRRYLANQVVQPRDMNDPRLLAPILALLAQDQNGGGPAAQPQSPSNQSLIDAINRP